jgi:hypothetical protein
MLVLGNAKKAQEPQEQATLDWSLRYNLPIGGSNT